MLPQGAIVVKAQFIDAFSDLAPIFLSGLYFMRRLQLAVRRAHPTLRGEAAMAGVYSPIPPSMRDPGDKKASILRTASKY
jgi:hypothetical protein